MIFCLAIMVTAIHHHNLAGLPTDKTNVLSSMIELSLIFIKIRKISQVLVCRLYLRIKCSRLQVHIDKYKAE